MKKLSIICAISLFASGVASAQDRIVKINGDKLLVEVVEVRSDEIAYRKIQNERGPLYTILKQEVYMVQYANGMEEVYTSRSSVSDGYESITDRGEELYFKGRKDANLYYKGNGAMWGTFGATILFAPVGLVTGVIIGAVPPKIENTAPDYKLLKELEYREGYTKKAKGRKWGKVALGFGVGLATNILVYSLVTSAN